MALGAGCRKSDSPQPLPELPPKDSAAAEDSSVVVRLHWIGRARLETDPTATNFMAIWNMPESKRLEAQTLDKFSTAPWRLLLGETNTTNSASALLRPLLNDVVENESYLEIRDDTNGPGNLVFAIRLEDSKAQVWETNMTAVIEAIGGEPISSTAERREWLMKGIGASRAAQLERAGAWLVFGVGKERSPLVDSIHNAINVGGVPFKSPDPNGWLFVDLDLSRMASALSLGWRLPEGLPHVLAGIAGDGANVLTRAEIFFPDALDLDLKPWNIPTNLIEEPLSGFTAIRSLGSFATVNRVWSDLQVGGPPDQMFLWSRAASPPQQFIAVPCENADEQLDAITGRLRKVVNPLLETNGWGAIEQTPEVPGTVWSGMPFLSAFLRTAVTNGQEFIYAGSFFTPTEAGTIPQELLSTLESPGLFGYSWEITADRLQSSLYISQLLRMVSGKAQLPDDCASIGWLANAGPHLGNCVTFAASSSSNTVLVVRQSTMGLSSTEIHLLADWLESPSFPVGLHTFRAPVPGLPEATEP